MQRLLLFDIDATLLLTGGAGMRAMKRASLELFGEGFRWDGIDSSGGLDSVLFRHAAKQSNLDVTVEDHATFRDRYTELLDEELRLNACDVRAMPGVHAVLDTLRPRKDVLLGILTGNYARAAALKLEAIDVDIDWFRLTVFGDEGASRPELGAVALKRYAALAGRPVEPERVIVIGDTPHDVHCARANGFTAFAVATGKHSKSELLAVGAHVAEDDLSNPATLLALLE